jgi:response regulator RpfG family c-di-GMP phosphodiesterase
MRGVCRDDARNVLVAMMAELGAQYLYFAIQVLHNACPAKGYTAHVLGYTLHAILETVSKVSYAHHIVHNFVSIFALSLQCTDAQISDVVCDPVLHATGKMVIAEALVLPSAFCKDLVLLSSSPGADLQDCACHVLFWPGVVRARMHDA